MLCGGIGLVERIRKCSVKGYVRLNGSKVVFELGSKARQRLCSELSVGSPLPVLGDHKAEEHADDDQQALNEPA